MTIGDGIACAAAFALAGSVMIAFIAARTILESWHALNRMRAEEVSGG